MKEKELRSLLAPMTLPDLRSYTDREGLKIKNRDKLGKEQLIDRIVNATKTREEVGV